MVEHLVANQIAGVRFSLSAQPTEKPFEKNGFSVVAVRNRVMCWEHITWRIEDLAR